MELSIIINDARLEHYSVDAKTELNKQLTVIAENLAEEANRIELGRRLPNSKAEVTQSDVVSASIISRISSRHKKNKWMYITQFVATFSGLAVGLIFDEDKFRTESWRLYAFMFLLIVLVVSTVLTFIQDGNK